MGKGKKIGIGIGVVIVAFFSLAIISAALTPDSNPPLSNSVADTLTVDDAPLNTTSIQTQQKVRVHDLTFQVVNATQDNRLITVVVQVDNNGSRIEYVSWLDFRLIDGQRQLYEDYRLITPDGEVAPFGSKTFQWKFRVPEGTDMTDCQLVILEDPYNLQYLPLVSS